jgi:hypothetical protein
LSRNSSNPSQRWSYDDQMHLNVHRVVSLTSCVAALHLALLAQSVQITPPATLELHNVNVKPLAYRGKVAMEIADGAPQLGDGVARLALIKDLVLRDGTIEVSLAGDTAADAPVTYRGFVGIAFRIGADRSRYECIYLRPKNGHAPDPVQRGHSVQYESEPDFPWNRLRADTPGKYEAWADLTPGEWTRIKIQIKGKRALLFVNDAKQPTLTVNDLKGTIEQGPIALWVGPGTIAHFAALHVTRGQ